MMKKLKKEEEISIINPKENGLHGVQDLIDLLEKFMIDGLKLRKKEKSDEEGDESKES